MPAHTITAIVTVPTSATKDAKVPGVVMLHGTGSNLHEVNGAYDMAAADMPPRAWPPSASTSRASTRALEKLYVNYSYTSANIDAKAPADYLAGLEVVDGGKLASGAGARAAPTPSWPPLPTLAPSRAWWPGPVLWT